MTINPNALDMSSATTDCGGNFVSPRSWTPADASGAGLTFAGAVGTYIQLGNVVIAFGSFAFPSTVNTDAAAITLPIQAAAGNQGYASCIAQNTGGLNTLILRSQAGDSEAIFMNAGGAQFLNSNLSAFTIYFCLIYPAF